MPKRVALLARPGPACDNLQSALQQAGAQVVLVADPTAGDHAALAAAAPQAVLVALEPSVEDALDGFEPILLDPAMIVIYDEVAVAAKREGWDAARWIRHLAAKLGGHRDVLPPGADSDDVAAPAPIAREPIAPEPVASEPFASEPVVPEPVAPEPVAPEPEFDTLTFDDVRFDADTDADDHDIAPPPAEADAGIDFGGLTEEMMAMLATGPVEEPARPARSEPDEPIPVIDWEAAPALEPIDDPIPEPEPEPEPEPLPAPAPPPAATPALSFSADEMSLVDIESDGAAKAGGSFAGAGTRPQGAVLVLAGIGGPDAVRQFLAAVPGEGFPRPVVVRQRLDGGRHDRLVQQMQRATSLPVELAEAGARLQPGRIYILPDGMAVAPQAGGPSIFSATDGPVPVLAGLPAGDSAILLLSGSDPAMVPEAMAAAGQGAVVAGQALEDCFDSAATAALIAAGGEAIAPAEFAQRLSTRWLSMTA